MGLDEPFETIIYSEVPATSDSQRRTDMLNLKLFRYVVDVRTLTAMELAACMD